MRRILLLAHRVPVDGGFTLNDLAGGGGRMDEIARSVSTAFTLSNDLRRDTEVTIIFRASPPPKARRIVLQGSRLRYLNPDERSTAALLKNALVRSIPLDRDVESSPGLFVGPVDPNAELRRFISAPDALWLREDGAPLESRANLGPSFSAVVSDADDPLPEEEEVLRTATTPVVSLGPRSLRASQCIDLLHAFFDRRDVTAARLGP
ncbi:MAG: tRNA (pseudouridine(54)-N(1))-methyltransferase TrmY [Thermoplasmata archaeon]|nr:tRNA (pseudouridine(54)-N(1))-methyltransferase TrmY [Thermoplasmata archaeon]